MIRVYVKILCFCTKIRFIRALFSAAALFWNLLNLSNWQTKWPNDLHILSITWIHFEKKKKILVKLSRGTKFEWQFKKSYIFRAIKLNILHRFSTFPINTNLIFKKIAKKLRTFFSIHVLFSNDVFFSVWLFNR